MPPVKRNKSSCKPNNEETAHEEMKGRKNRPKDQRISRLSLKERVKIVLSGKYNIGLLYICSGLAILMIMFAFYMYQRGRLYTKLKTASVAAQYEKYGSKERFWGTYRPQLYFGVRHKGPKSLIAGLMWFSSVLDKPNKRLQLRHECNSIDNLPKFGWSDHDGKSFGKQQITDYGFEIETDFVKRTIGDYGGDWSVRISSKALPASPQNQMITFLFYVGQEGNGELLPEVDDEFKLTGIAGSSDALKEFRLSFRSTNAQINIERYLATRLEHFHLMKEFVSANLRPVRSKGSVRLLGLFDGRPTDDPTRALQDNLIIYQLTARLPIEFEVIFESKVADNIRPYTMAGTALTNLIKIRQEEFDRRFEKTFKLKSMGFNNDYIIFGKAALSNVLGGIGYFYGSSKVISEYFSNPTDYFEVPLLTGTPSRSSFPRGFLWDEGFHQLLICKWDRELSMEIIAYWLDLINEEGWIPREQILGEEARIKVPTEFIVQNNEIANPPTLVLALHSLQSELEGKENKLPNEFRLFFQLVFPRLDAWFTWFNSTQKGLRPGTYRWLGRRKDSDTELNPKTLASGLDDYPRASHPSRDEAHIDLRCWITAFTGYMHHLAISIGKKNEAVYYARQFISLLDQNELDRLHWSHSTETYCDYGNHTKYVQLKYIQNEPGQPPKMLRVVTSKKSPSLRYVHQFGYVSLFPFLMHLLPASSTNLHKILLDLAKPELLWTEFGLRSLAKNSKFYMKHNTEHDPPYWRGSIWINMNFLAVRALNYYRKIKGPYQQLAGDLYIKLRDNVVNTVFKEYRQTGYFWEQYHSETGKGQGAHPFNGWTSLVLLIMAENY